MPQSGIHVPNDIGTLLRNISFRFCVVSSAHIDQLHGFASVQEETIAFHACPDRYFRRIVCSLP